MSVIKKLFEKKDPDGMRNYLALFNGLHELGGEKLGYEHSMLHLEGSPARQLAIEVACIIIASKPSKVLFAGLTGEEYRKKYGDGISSGDLEKAETEGKIEVLEKKMTKLEALIDKHKDDEDEDGMAKILEKMAKCNEELIEARLELEMEEDGDDEDVSQGAEDSTVNALHSAIAAFLPKLTSNDISNYSAEQKAAYHKSRMNWKDEFKDVNLTSCRRIAYMALQLRTRGTSIHRKWITIHEGRPLKAKAPARFSKETRDIFETNIGSFKEEKEYWNVRKISKVFKRWPKSGFSMTDFMDTVPGFEEAVRNQVDAGTN